VLPIASLFSLTDLWDRSIKWIMKNLSRVCNAKDFTALPQSIIDKCVQCMQALIVSVNWK